MGMLPPAAGRVWDFDPGTAREHVERAEAVAAKNLAEARRLVRDLLPPCLEGTSLAGALRGLCADLAREARLSVEFRLEGAETAVDDATRLAVLRVAQTALSNMVDHAGASAVVVTLSFLGAELSLDVVDDGRCPPAVADSMMRHLRQPRTTLTAREVEILRALARGDGNRAIAKRLFITEATVKTHLVHIYAKLGVDSRTAAVAAALQRRLIRL